MIIGRGTHIEDIAIRPSQKMGIRSNLIFTGYKKEDFISTLSCLNFKVFLVPGSDGSCRAVREAMAMGIPVIAANRGMLPEIVDHQKNGLVIEDTPEKLAEAIMYMVEHPEKRREMGASARQKAGTQFSPAAQVTRTEQIYEQVMKKKQKRAG
jgi:glycosyltransferase involved in cell wall biosynthesis